MFPLYGSLLQSLCELDMELIVTHAAGPMSARSPLQLASITRQMRACQRTCTRRYQLPVTTGTLQASQIEPQVIC